MNIALTGASGFIGRHLKNAISKLAGVNLILIVRNKDNSVNNNQLSFQEFFDIKWHENDGILMILMPSTF